MRVLWGGWRGLEGLGSAAMAGHGGGELGSGGEGDAVREFERGRGQTARGLTGERRGEVRARGEGSRRRNSPWKTTTVGGFVDGGCGAGVGVMNQMH